LPPLRGTLRCSTGQAAGNSRYALKQSSPKSPGQPALLGGAQGKQDKSQNRKSGEQQVAHPNDIDRKYNSTPVH